MTDSDDSASLTARQFRTMERAQAVSKALTDAARRARFSSRARSAYAGGSFKARRGATLIRAIAITLFVMTVAVPNVVAIIYFGLIASNQFASEAKFTISSAAIPKMDGLGSVTGLPPMLIMQDTQVITNFIHSRAIVDQLERTIGLRETFASSAIDWWARFRRDKPIEKLTDYWGKRVDASIGFPSGIVTLSVRAFSPGDAKRIADAVVRLSENLINEMNDRMRRDIVLASEGDMQRAADQLSRARTQMELARNAEGILDVGQTGSTLNGLIASLEGDLLKAEQEYQTQLRYVNDSAPQMRVLKSRIAAMRSQLEEMKAQLTSQTEKGISAVADRALAGKMTKFAELDLEQRIAEKRYALAVAAVESARMMSERKMLYLHQIVAPALPEESQYPRRLLSIIMIMIASVVVWGVSVGAMVFVRNHMA